MTRANAEIPHYYLSHTVSMRRAVSWLGEQNDARPVTERLLPAALLIKATARALRRVPELNGLWIDGALRPSDGVHVGMAISLRGGGVVVPCVHRADELSLDALMTRVRELVERARAGTLTGSELMDSTVTITSLGERGPEAVYGVIFPPQVALVGFGSILERPWVVGGQVVPQPVVTVTLAADHRASDGHRGGLLLAEIDKQLQKPEEL
jgi:pyruvate dehydrogenase E2 component (dihydrolipoamide acetyltransferase)